MEPVSEAFICVVTFVVITAVAITGIKMHMLIYP